LVSNSFVVQNITGAASGGTCNIFFEIELTDSTTGLPSNIIECITITAATAVVGTPYVSIRSLGLASQAFVIGDVTYYLGAYQSAFSNSYQNTYFLINGSASTSENPVIVAKLAYENGGGYLQNGLPNVTVKGSVAQVSYLFKDLIQAVNKNTNVPSGNQVAGIYSQTGVNLATFTFDTQDIDTAEIGGDLHLTGGFLWMYDGYLPVEHNFFLFPDVNISSPTRTAEWSATGGSMHAQPGGGSNTNAYFYQITYEWTDNQGNAFRSAPSIPIAVTTTGTGTSGSVYVNVPTLRLTYKVANPVKIVIYRWSLAQQEYYQVTSITSPLLNDTTVDHVTFIDTLEDSSILGNNLIYTTGGVLEDSNAPASNLLTLFDTRLWLVDSEDKNLLYFSKQVIESTPVEMSDLLTMYIPPTTGAQGSTGPITAISVMDDKLIIFKHNAIYYVNGTGPDNTGANSQYSPPIFITSTVGCDNQNSIVLMPQGLMFQSDKGIWLLGRGLDTNYIGAPVEQFNSAIVESAQNIPATNQVRFILSSGVTLMYDYFYGQWGTFTGVPAVRSCIYQNLHTFINKYGNVYQETIGVYLDGSNPVLMQFTTGPLRLDALQSYQRAYFFYLLGTYISPHKLQISVAYDYSQIPEHSVIITPINANPAYGQPSPYGQGNPYGGVNTLESWRVFLSKQRCSAFSISLQEIFDPSLGLNPGAGLTLSGLNVVCAFKKGFRPQNTQTSVG
jgi:hypothetical protein